MSPRLFTVAEANSLLGTLDPILERAQTITAQMRDARDQLVDLRIIWGERIQDSSCPDHAEYERYRSAFSQAEQRLQATLSEVTSLGCELKDLEVGLVDFTAARGEELVSLCWKRGERRVEWWHPLESGYAARQPLKAL